MHLFVLCAKIFGGKVKDGIQVGPMQDSDETYFLETASDEKRAFNNGMKICGDKTKIATHPKFHNIRRMGDASKGYIDQAS